MSSNSHFGRRKKSSRLNWNRSLVTHKDEAGIQGFPNCQPTTMVRKESGREKKKSKKLEREKNKKTPIGKITRKRNPV